MSAFITRLIDVILSEAKILGLIAAAVCAKLTEMFRSAQHDSDCVLGGSILAGNHIFAETRRVGVGEIRRVLIGLIEHFSSAARISAVLLDQGRDQPDIFVG